jgi:hypothetical protein
MSTQQPRAFSAANNVLAFAQAFSTASVHDGDQTVRTGRASRRGPSILRLRRHRAGR